MACACCTPKVVIVFAIFSLACFVVSLVLDFKIIPDVIKDQVNKATRLENGTDQFDRFMELPFPIDFKVYLFQVMNPKEILEGAKPNVTEIGPYSYLQHRQKTIIGTNPDEDTITYTQMETFTYAANLSDGHSEDETVTILNPVKSSLYQLSENISPLLPGLIEQCLEYIFPDPETRETFIKIKVKDILFDGVKFCTPISLNDIADEKKFCFAVQGIACIIASTKRNIEVLDDKSLSFSLFRYKAKAPDGEYTVKRGLDDITKLGHIVQWNGLTYTDYWGNGTTCSEIKGTDSTLYPPRVHRDESFHIFSTDICRYVEIQYKNDGTYKDIDGYLFGTDKKTLVAKTENPSDDCYCTKKIKGLNGEETCFLDGAVDMYTCTKVPVLFTFPHFLWADNYRELIDGMNPDEDIHKIFLLVEPNTGIPLQGSKKIQLNMVFRSIPGVKELEKLDVGRLMPLIWLDEGVSLTDDLIDMLNSLYFSKVKLADGLKWTLTAVTALATVALSGLYIFKRRSKAKETV